MEERLNDALAKETQEIFQTLGKKTDNRLGSGHSSRRSRTSGFRSRLSRVPTSETQRPSQVPPVSFPPPGHDLPSEFGTSLTSSTLLQYSPWVEEALVKNLTFEVLYLPELLRDEDARRKHLAQTIEGFVHRRPN